MIEISPFVSMHIFECVYFSGVSIVYLKERNVYRNRGSKTEKRRLFSMDAFLITIMLAILLSVGGTIISLRLFAHRSERVSRPRSERRVYIAPSSYTTDTNISIEDSETARYARKVMATLVILLVILSTLIYSAFHALVVH
jgi:hypothetical protein